MNERDRPARVAVVGAGRMGMVHLRALGALAAADVVAVVDPSAIARDHVTAMGITAMSSVPELVAAGGIDAAIVAVPTPAHAAVCEELLGAGIATLCEKPAGPDSATTRRLAALAGSTRVPLQVGYWRRFVPSLQALREDVASGRFGSVSLVLSEQWDHRPPPAAFRASSGGLVIDMGVHEFDQIRWLTGQEFEALSWTASTVRVDPEVDGDPESGAIIGRLSGGTVAIVTLGRSYPQGDMCRVQLVGPDRDARDEFLSPADGDRAFVDAVARQAAAFVAFARGAAWTGASIDDAVAALDVAEAVGALAEDGAG